MKPEIRNGWTLLFHPAFQASFDRLIGEVTALKAADPTTWKEHPKAKLLERIRRIPPVRAAYRRGGRAAMLHS